MTTPSNSHWTPLDCLAVGRTTASGLLQKEWSTEVELLLLPCGSVELRANGDDPLVPLTGHDSHIDTSKSLTDWIDHSSRDLQLFVTTHRLVFLSAQRECRYLHLCNLFALQVETKFLKSPKLVLNTAFGELIVAFVSSKGDAKKQRDDAYQHLERSWRRQQWEHDETKEKQQQQQRKATASSHRVGVDAILNTNKTKHQMAANLTDTAFAGDAETLLQEATELVQIIHKYVATLDRQSVSEDDNSNNPDSDRLLNLLSDMGMTTALRKADYKGREDTYYETTARQLADFVLPKLQVQRHGVLTLTDVYCMYNRARGSHLLSPEDLLQAVERLDQLHMCGLSLHTYPDSGLRVLRDASASDESVNERLRLLCEERYRGISDTVDHTIREQPLTALYVAREMHIPVVLATEQLRNAERAELLVRDETLESLGYYPNRFREW